MCHLVLACALACAAGGCASPSRTEDWTTAPAPGAESPGAAEFPVVRLQVGDEIEVKFAYAEQFNEAQAIRPDGRISLQLIGDVTAAGKTLSELRDELMDRYAAQLKHPELVVIARALNDRRVYVGGAVKTPGLVPMPGRLTVLEAILQSGGFDLDQAERDQVVVIRQENGARRNFLLNVEDQIHRAEGPVFELMPRDIVYVPRTRISDVNLWVQQHLYKVLPPINFTVGYGF